MKCTSDTIRPPTNEQQRTRPWWQRFFTPCHILTVKEKKMHLQIFRFTIILILIASSQAQGDEIKTKGRFLGQDLPVVEAAVAAFKDKGLNLKKYEITIVDLGENCAVLFRDPNCDHKHWGSCPNLVSLEVKIEKGTYKVLTSHYSR